MQRDSTKYSLLAFSVEALGYRLLSVPGAFAIVQAKYQSRRSPLVCAGIFHLASPGSPGLLLLFGGLLD